MAKPEPTLIEATAAHEMFYNDVMASALKHKLQDREIIALLALIIGRACGVALPGSDQNTLIDTAIYNLKFGREKTGRLVDALGKGH